jgi:hypothetical protein
MYRGFLSVFVDDMHFLIFPHSLASPWSATIYIQELVINARQLDSVAY